MILKTMDLTLRLRRWLVTVASASVLVAASPAWGQEALFGAAERLCAEAVETIETTVHAGRQRIVQPMAMKLVRGVTNLTLGWAELPKQVGCTWQRRGWLIGVTRGSIEGAGMSVARMLAGAYEIVTFPLPVPPRYQPMVTPDYVWQPEPSHEE
jgi:putative exosortase-associated protein (TIGR04073 family)